MANFIVPFNKNGKCKIEYLFYKIIKPEGFIPILINTTLTK